ncbi:hypothetical protein [Comamonas sp. JC664]|uniref:hypothetical protein n=1 Tax=Comamonas sp. JC664 TaxID=2801917 RepID=UPI00174B2F3A|nr:hypothetical protein [Comamonas sp. JC664]MBL0698951.1 hypothetical protein [Comamonas sp. JC664]GHG79740.1 hypothetical protein GCM10012319_31900 [Comamonas sp. KCTC 72670]
MSPTIETAVITLAASQLLVPLLQGLLSRRQAKHEAAVEQVPLLVERLGTVADGVRDIKAELRRVGEHDSLLKQVDLRLKALESWQGEARPQLARASSDTHLLMGERSARQMQHAANVVAAQDAGRSRP